MKRNEIFEKVNEVIDILEGIYNEQLLNYIIQQIVDNGYCDEEDWQEYAENSGEE